ncbi:MAG TPA: VOC family protein [Polyangiaceae bacterium]|nr:VOC family protein [Polyangiaceae bacterium]
MTENTLGLLGYDSYTFVVENLARSRDFYVNKFDFREVARGSDAWAQRTGELTSVFAAGQARVIVTSPLTQSSAAARYLRRHPAGVSTLSFRVADLDRARAFLAKRDATFLDDDVDERDGQGGRYRSFSIATPLGDVAFRFVERTDYRLVAPGLETSDEAPFSLVPNRFGIAHVDHVTSNARTMAPVVRWYRDTLGFEEFWNIQFHTRDVAPSQREGTGLKSIVMWDRESGVKFATNEPLAPNFEQSQISKFCSDNRGPGIQHIAFALPDIISSTAELRRRGVAFLHTPASYYRALPERLERLKIRNVKEDLRKLEELEIEIDGADDKYMLQIFLRDAAGLYDDERAGPFFYEIIQRAGDPGFGYGNFRALFESIEREQRQQQPPG